jgi:hypothetical protein
MIHLSTMMTHGKSFKISFSNLRYKIFYRLFMNLLMYLNRILIRVIVYDIFILCNLLEYKKQEKRDYLHFKKFESI